MEETYHSPTYVDKLHEVIWNSTMKTKKVNLGRSSAWASRSSAKCFSAVLVKSQVACAKIPKYYVLHKDVNTSWVVACGGFSTLSEIRIIEVFVHSVLPLRMERVVVFFFSCTALCSLTQSGNKNIDCEKLLANLLNMRYVTYKADIGLCVDSVIKVKGWNHTKL